MKWSSPLLEAVLINRYKRFLADVTLQNETVTIHVPNTGSMLSCWAPEWPCAVSRSDNPTRKLPHTLELIWNGETWIGVNTANANKLARLWIESGLLPELSGYPSIQPEKKVGASRIDFYLEGHANLPPAYVEVKSVTLKQNNRAEFPDSVSERGQKHLRELMDLKKSGYRAVMLFIVQREDVRSFSPAHTIDLEYGRLLGEAQRFGVEILVYQCKMSLEGVSLGKSLPYEL